MTTSLPNQDIDTACKNAASAFAALSRFPPESRARILDTIAAALDTQRGHILQTCADETALTIDELTPEFARMTGTLRMFAAIVRDGSWCRAAIDTPVPNSGPNPAPNPNRNLPLPLASQSPIGPNHDIRSLLTPLGPVAVFGSSNFPLAYGVCGGDTASALAAGCPVIVKEHPAHPITGRLLADIAQHAIAHAFDEPDAQARNPAPSRAPAHLLQYIPNKDPKDFSIARELVQHPALAAVGFTGSIPGGLAIEKLARERELPIPIFAEMGSANLVVITLAAAEARHDEISRQIAASIAQRFGQQCTCPGVVMPFPYEAGAMTKLIHSLAERIGAEPARRMLSPHVAQEFLRRTEEESGVLGTQILARGQGVSGSARPKLLRASLKQFLSDPRLQDEMFGPAALVIHPDEPYAEKFVDRFRGMLVASIFHEPEDLQDARFVELVRAIASRAGRIAFNSPPTGVRVTTSMVHGGPFPATNRPDTTAVGPRAIERWCRPICFQNCPDNLLPPELQSANPLEIWRTLNGQLTKASLP